MSSRWSFPRQVLLTLLAVGGIAVYPLLTFGNTEHVIAAAVGAVMATVNVLLGYAAIEYSFGKSTTTFFKVVLGGMGIRLIAMAAVLVLLIRVFHFHVGALIVSMGVFYSMFLTLEILYIHRKVSVKQNS